MAAVRWSLRDAGPLYIERGRAATLRLQAYRNQVATAATSGTLTIVDAGGNTIVTGATSTDGTDTTYALLAGDTDTTMAYSARWRARWALTISGETKNFEADVWLVRSVLYPVVTVDDLITGRHRDLADLVDGGVDSIEGYGIEAWKGIEADLIKRGKRLNLIMEPWALRNLHLYRWLELCFNDALTRFAGNDAYEAHRDRYAELATAEWDKGVKFDYDANEDGLADVKATGSNTLFLTAGNMTGPAWTRRLGRGYA